MSFLEGTKFENSTHEYIHSLAPNTEILIKMPSYEITCTFKFFAFCTKCVEITANSKLQQNLLRFMYSFSDYHCIAQLADCQVVIIVKQWISLAS